MLVRLAVLALLAVLLAGCGGEEAPEAGGAAERELRVAASFYPLEEIAQAVGGSRAEVTGLTPPGTGPHDVELESPQLAALEDADVLLYLGAGFQPAVERAARSLPRGARRVDLLRSLRLRAVDEGIPGVRGEVDGERLAGGRDPHVWVDPRTLLALVERVRRALTAADPEGRAAFARGAAAYAGRLRALDREFARGLADCSSRTLVTSHAAFGYLADRYDLVQAPIAGISPDDEPDPRSLAATARRAKADGVKTVFFETLVPRRLLETVAREIGARTDALDPVEGLTREQLDAGESYFTIQRENLAALRRGLGCTGR